MKTVLVFITAWGTQRIPSDEVNAITQDDEIPHEMIVNLKNGKELYVTKQEITIEHE